MNVSGRVSTVTKVLVLGLLALLLCLPFSAAPVLAQEEGEAAAEEEQTRRTGSMSEKTYRKLAEAALGLGLTHSRSAYPASPAPKHDVAHAMVDAAEKLGH